MELQPLDFVLLGGVILLAGIGLFRGLSGELGSIAGFAANFLGPLLVWFFWTRVSRTPFSLRSPRDLLRHSLVLVASALLETAIIAPAVALVYPEVDISLFAWSVFGNTATFPIVLGIPLSILLEEEFGFVPETKLSRS